MKNQKLRFIRAVRLAAPQNNLVLQFAASLGEMDNLPDYPGATVIESVGLRQAFPALELHSERSQRSSSSPGMTPPPHVIT